MFNGLQINLGAESRTRKVDDKNFDAVEAYAAVVGAGEALDRTAMQMDMLQTSMHNVEVGQALATAVADATGDNGVAVAVGRESLRMSLSMIGQSGMAEEAYVGAESITAGAEAAENIFSKMWTKVKELAVKAWKWIIELINKITNFVLGLFGKSEDTAEKLLKLLKSVKEDGRTKLDATEFDKAVAVRLAKEIPLLASKSKTSLTDYKDSITNTLVQTSSLTDIIKDAETAGNNPKKVVETTLKAIKEVTKTEKIGTTPIGYVSRETEGADLKFNSSLLNQILPSLVTAFTNSAPSKITDDISGIDLDDAVSEISDEIYMGKAKVISSTPDKVVVLGYGLSEDGKETYDYLVSGKDSDGTPLNKDKGYKKVGPMINKIYNSIKTKTVIVKIDDISDATDKFEDIVPLDYTDCKAIADELKKANKEIEKNLKEYNKAIKDADKKVDTEFKTNSATVDTINSEANGEDASELRNMAKVMANIIEKTSKVNLDINREIAKALTDSSNAVARSKIGHVITESVKLWVKK